MRRRGSPPPSAAASDPPPSASTAGWATFEDEEEELEEFGAGRSRRGAVIMGAFDLIFGLLKVLWSLLCRIFSAVFGGGSGRGSGVTVTFDDGRSVTIGKQIAEGGFSFVFEARDATSSRGGGGRRLYALKRINCGDEDIVEQCRREAGVHRTFDHPNLMPLLGMKFESSSQSSSAHSGGRRGGRPGNDTCYMLFPYLPRSLRGDITRRRLLDDDASETRRRPYSEREALTIFAGVVDAVRTMHDAGLSHRDVKVENVLLKDEGSGGTSSRGRGVPTPVLMDFGSSGPLSVPLRSRSDVLRITDEAAQHTTLPYRAPELFDGGVRHGPSEPNLDYGRCDVWSLGCLLFALLYGSSPFEVEWRKGDGTVRIVDCTHLKVLGPVPFPPKGSAAHGRYGEDVKDLIRWMLNQARAERPSAGEVAERAGRLMGGESDGATASRKKKGGAGREADPFDSIVSRQSNAV